MNSVNAASVFNPPHCFSIVYHLISEGVDRSIQILRTIPQQMHNHPFVVFSFFLTANAVNLFFINFIADYLEKRVNESPSTGIADWRFNYFLINIVLTGGWGLFFNTALVIATNIDMSKIATAGILAYYIGLRILLSKLAYRELSSGNGQEPQAYTFETADFS